MATTAPPPSEPESPPEADSQPSASQPGATEPGATANAGSEHPPQGFFGWLRATGLRREEGWLGGALEGIARRIGIDPVIVRGITVVIALLGGPALLLYAALWLLLPDRDGRIHLEELLRGRAQPALLGIGALIVLAVLPVAQGIWWAGAGFWGTPDWGGALARGLWIAVLLGASVALLVWLAPRIDWSGLQGAARPDRAEGTTPASAPPATAAGPAAAAAATPASTAVHAETSSTAPSSTTTPAPTDDREGEDAGVADTIPTPPPPGSPPAPVAPPAPSAEAGSEELAAWRAQHEAWRQQHQEWKQAQAESRREQRLRQREEDRLTRESWRLEQERYRRSNPGIGFLGFVLIAGIATTSGGIAAIATPATVPGLAVGLGVGALVLALGLIGAGALRRRSGPLGVLAFVTTVAALLAMLVPPGSTLLQDRAAVMVDRSSSYSQYFGQLHLDLNELGTRKETGSLGDTVIVVDVWQFSGTVNIQAPANLNVQIEAHGSSRLQALELLLPGEPPDLAQAEVTSLPVLNLPNGNREVYTAVALGASVDHPDVFIRIWQGNGWVQAERLITEADTMEGVEQ